MNNFCKGSLALLLSLFFTDCIMEDNEQEIADLAAQNMKIIPENPTSKDEIKLVVFDDCTYNILSGVEGNGKTIDIQKQFNSMMKWPCVIKNDTIMIGKLSQGTYTVNYKLVDIADPNSPQISRSLTFNLSVFK